MKGGSWNRTGPSLSPSSLAQSLLVADPARRLERESKVVRHLLRPLSEHRLRRHAIERIVDLDRVEMPGVEAQHLAGGELLRIERALPFFIRVAARSSQHLHEVVPESKTSTELSVVRTSWADPGVAPRGPEVLRRESALRIECALR